MWKSFKTHRNLGKTKKEKNMTLAKKRGGKNHAGGKTITPQKR